MREELIKKLKQWVIENCHNSNHEVIFKNLENASEEKLYEMQRMLQIAYIKR